MKRTISKKILGQKTVDGAGVHMTRVLSNDTVYDFDPILLLDSFDSANPNDYMAGFPMHPHRGIQTVTYISKGNIQHKDSMDNEDKITDGEVQWMIAGSGIIHEESFEPAKRMLGVQLWLNLPQKYKMINPQYITIKKENIPVINKENVTIKVLAGNYGNHRSYKSEISEFDFYDITLEKDAIIEIDTYTDDTIILFTLENDAIICDEHITEKTAVLTSQGDSIMLKGTENGSNILYIRSKALKEPIVWGGTIVMNTHEELANTFRELRNGEFLKVKSETYNARKF